MLCVEYTSTSFLFSEPKFVKIKYSIPKKWMIPFKIAIDGPSGVGKSSTASKLAEMLGFSRIDSGTLYRAITYILLEDLYVKEGNVNNNYSLDEEIIYKTEGMIKTIDMEVCSEEIKYSYEDSAHNKINKSVNKKELKNTLIDKNVSMAAKHGFIREIVLAIQKKIIENVEDGVVIDGRDIGTIVMPNADLKIYLTASEDVRAKRRYDEMVKGDQKKKFKESYDDILKAIVDRDYQDMNRKVAPLKKADDAIIVNNDDMSLDEQTTHIYNLAIEKINSKT